jgi:hypothetical protein
MKNTQESMWKIYDTLNEWIRFSDAKAGVILATNGIIAGAILSDPAGLKAFLYKNPVFFIPLILAVLMACISIYFSLRCLNPTLKIGKPDSLIFFGHIALNFETAEEYQSVAKKIFLDDDLAESQIAEQIWANSKISQRKFEAVTWATRFLAVTAFIGILSILAVFLP